jgi:DNA-binding HxlR family transcriptional regulator
MSSIIELLPARLAVMLGKDYEAQDCSLARALGVIGERWTLLIIRDAFYGVRRFNDFQAHLDVPRAVLSDRLTGLVEDGILERQPDPAHAGRHIYALTAAGRDLWPALHALMTWGDRHRHRNSRLFEHGACGTVLDGEGRCARCGLTPGPDDIVTVPRPGLGTARHDSVAVALRKPRRLLDPIDAE